MTEITRVHLENEMDLILCHKQTMKLAELCGFGLSTQTNLATAVSELARSALECQAHGELRLLISEMSRQERSMVIQVRTTGADGFTKDCNGFRYARRLMPGIRMSQLKGVTVAEMNCVVGTAMRIDAEIIDRWRRYMNTDPEVSPYEEIKRKNRQLQELANRVSESEQQYRDLTDSLPLIICAVDANGILLFGNRWLKDYSGLSIGQLNDARSEGFIHPDDYPELLENMAKLSSGEFHRDREYRLRNGTTSLYRWHMGSITPVSNDDGEVKYWSIFLADIHAQKEMEVMLKDNRELRETKLLLEEKVEALDITNKQLEQFAYVASHDLQEPLRKIMHFSNYLETRYAKTLPEDAMNVLKRMNIATGRMKALVSDVLSYATIPNQNPDWELVDMNGVVQNVLEELELDIAERDAQVTIGDLPVVEGISGQLRQLMYNLLSNSLKYSAPERKTQIRISGELSGESLTLKVEDNGIGFENQYLPKMFTIFQRLHGREKYSGTGIGLAICKKIVELHNGTITAQGEPGNGATFVISLPLSQSAAIGDQQVQQEY
jgi:hypothetical protein